MKTQYFYQKDGIYWSIFADEYSGFSESQYLLSDISTILGEVCRVFEESFELETLKAHPVLSVLHCDDGPITFRKNALIFLSSHGRFYNQQIHQFSHELCHFMVGENPVNEYRWLDETLAQMMSWYAMNKIYKSRNDQDIFQLSTLYKTMPNYVSSDMQNKEDLNGESIAHYIYRNSEYLQKNCDDRRKNNTIAHEIYPLFCGHPELWKIVPFLDQLTPDIVLEDALQLLGNLANIPSGVLDCLTQRLCH